MKLDSKLLSYKDGENVKIWNAKTKEFDDLGFIKQWKKNGTLRDMMALLPFIRNIYEMNKDRNNSDFQLISKFLHYKTNHESLCLDELDHIYNNESIAKHTDYSSNTYFSILTNEVNEILRSPVKESQLSNKIILGIYLRVLSDKLLYNKFLLLYGCEPDFAEGDWTKSLRNSVFNSLNEKELGLYNSAVVIAPNFIHINSFMYEPLIDVDTVRIGTIIRDLQTYFDESA